jgi:hypothetical protein
MGPNIEGKSRFQFSEGFEQLYEQKSPIRPFEQSRLYKAQFTEKREK